MKKLILVLLCILCICIPAYSAFKEQTIFGKSIDIIKSTRSSAVNAEAILKNNQNTATSLLTSYASTISAEDKTNLNTINTKISTVLTDLNDLISTIDTLYPEIK